MGEISRFLQNKTIFITGATGFLGKPLIAKILSEFPDVKKIYLLIRSKKQPDGSCLSAQQRLEAEVFSSNVFDKLRQSHGSNFERFICQKIIGVSGDIAEPSIGLEPEIYSRLTQEVQIVINSAAVVVFDERLDEALKMNTFAPLNLLNFAKTCNHAIFLHVSTAYVSGNASGNIPEEISNHRNIDELDVEAEYDQALKMTQRIESESRSPKMWRRFRREELRLSSGADKDNKDKREKLESRLEAARERWVRQQLIDYGMKRSKARGWNDTYTYTKSLGERMILKHRSMLPTVILRPSIIESSLEEPEPGWIDGFRMADPLIFGFGKGRIDDFPGNPQSVIDLIPVDFVVNAMLASLLKGRAESEYVK
jgi:nucleoside-diphosphate-sugar epimerase